MFHSKKELIFIALAMFFAADAVTAELIGGKLITIFGRTFSIGVIPWPIVFIATDVINEFYGKKGVRRLSFITAGLIAYAYLVLYAAMSIKASPYSQITDDMFRNVFGTSMWLIIGSLIAFVSSQLIDNSAFWMLRKYTGHKMVWLRSTGSTLISQFFDTALVLGVGFWLPAQLYPDQYKFTTDTYINIVITQYVFKVAIAILATPLIYVGHGAITRVLGHAEAHAIIEETARHSLGADYDKHLKK
jgi:uncharacterized integral membrane protein (TIGR00697 family)